MMVRKSVSARFAALVFALALAGCATAPDRFVGRYRAAEDATGIATVVLGPEAALAGVPAAAGPVLSVRQTPYANGVMQEIVLGSGPPSPAGENKIVVKVESAPDPDWRGARDDMLRVEAASNQTIEAELAERFPRLRMQVSPDFEATAQGPIGYASGSSGGVNCLYAWQFLAPEQPLSLIDGAVEAGAHPISLRLRLCRTQPLTTLLSVMRHLSVGRATRGASVPLAGLGGQDALAVAAGASTASLDEVLQAGPPDQRTAPPAPRSARRAGARKSIRPRAPRLETIRQKSPPPAEAADAAAPHIPLPGDIARIGVVSQGAAAVRPRPAEASAAADDLPLPK